MAWRFTASKFKNTTPKLPKKENGEEYDEVPPAAASNRSSMLMIDDSGDEDAIMTKKNNVVTCKLKIHTDTIFDVPVGNLSCTDDGIHASADFLAFHIEGEGGKLGVLPIGAKGRRTRNDLWIIAAHGEQVSDFGFMTYADQLLATCSRDEPVKIWKLSRESSPQLATEIDVGGGVIVECLRAHSTADNILAVGSHNGAYITDISTKRVAIELTGVTDKVQSMDWSEDGRLLAVSGDKGRQIVVYDPRASTEPIQTLEGHGGMGREARVLFAGDRLISTGFTTKRIQEVRAYDTGKWGAPIHTQEFVSTTGVLIPHYDPDTRLIFLSGKGTNKLFMMELQDRQPCLSNVFELTLPEQTLGATIGAKRRVHVMDGEVDTYYQLTKNSIVPTPCIVPRRSYRDFHTDLFPDTRGGEPGCSASEWLSGTNATPQKVSLAPSTTSSSPPPPEPVPPQQQQAAAPAPRPMSISSNNVPNGNHHHHHHNHHHHNHNSTTNNTVTQRKEEVRELDYGVYEKENGAARNFPKSNESSAHTPSVETSSTQGNTSPISSISPDPVTVVTKPRAASTSSVKTTTPTTGSVSTPSVVGPSFGETAAAQSTAPVNFRKPIGASNRVPLSRVRPKSCVVGQITSKFRHVDGQQGTKSGHVFSNLRNVNTRLPPESNGVCCSNKFAAVPLAGLGVIGIYDIDAPGKLPDGVMDGIFNKALVTDLQWNPFDEGQLAVGTDCGQINLWRFTSEDGPRNEMEPEKTIKIGGEKITSLRWHPLAANLMAVALSNSTIELWDVAEPKLYSRFVNHTGGILGIAWSADGRRIASVGKDATLFVHEPASQEQRVYERKSVVESTRAARVLFACDDRIVIVVGMTKSSQRQVQMYDATTTDLRHIYTQVIDSATQPLVPHLDYDSNVLFLSGKGDRFVNMFEVIYDSPYLLPLAPFMSPVGSQGIAFHHKIKCNVMAVEFQVCWRLSDKNLEQIVFRVPRVKKDVFQDDLFPDAFISWEPVTTAAKWMTGEQAAPVFRSLKPDGVFSSIPRPMTASIRHSDMPTTSTSAGVTPSSSSAITTPTSTLSSSEKHHTSHPTPIARSMQSCAVESAHTPDRKQVRTQEWSSMDDDGTGGGDEDSEYYTDENNSDDLFQNEQVEEKVEEEERIRIPACLLTPKGNHDEQEEDDDDEDYDVAAAWSTKIDVDTRLEQDQMEGVDETEWNQ
ncbi:CBN-POD-1 protein [Caenorhabditis brenneri]|uniref:Coronin n=1 Tax=Caenorhabditis brenneri TaxID=135651 RepID=G0NGR6_CAEBE|nr:CBN-POD-1 protein [Caenorhabditis brenneri]